MKEIQLTRGMVALVDDEDFEWLNQWKWYAAHANRSKFYAARDTRRGKRERGGIVYMHRQIMDAGSGLEVDHKNGNSLDCRRGNLRLCDHPQNCRNIRQRCDNHSGYRGVTWCKRDQCWRVEIHYNGAKKQLGRFDDLKAAALAYNTAAIELHGEFARLNEV